MQILNFRMGNDMRHKHADLIIAWANGAVIEYLSPVTEEWQEISDPTWCLNIEYRIKPEPKPDVVKFLGCRNYGESHGEFCNSFGIVNHWHNSLKLTFCGDTGKLKSAEVLK